MTPDKDAPLLTVNNLTMRFGGLTAVNNVEFSVKVGEVLSVIGPNGAGKTTVFNAITGIYCPTAGSIRFHGKDVRETFSWKTLFKITATALVTALGLVLLLNVQGLWTAGIIANYSYREPFSWGKAVGAIHSFLWSLPAELGSIPAILGFVLGGFGSLVVWNRSRFSTACISQQGIARTFQNIRLFTQMTVLENVLLGMDCRLKTGVLTAALRLPRFFIEEARSKQRAFELLRFVGLEHEMFRVSSTLSYGDQRRLEIARALATNPKLLLLDEPAAGMNPTESAELIALIRKIRERGITVILIEHHMNVVMGISDRIVVLDYGNKIAEGTPDQILANTKVIDAYLGKDYEG